MSGAYSASGYCWVHLVPERERERESEREREREPEPDPEHGFERDHDPDREPERDPEREHDHDHDHERDHETSTPGLKIAAFIFALLANRVSILPHRLTRRGQ